MGIGITGPDALLLGEQAMQRFGLDQGGATWLLAGRRNDSVESALTPLFVIFKCRYQGRLRMLGGSASHPQSSSAES